MGLTVPVFWKSIQPPSAGYTKKIYCMEIKLVLCGGRTRKEIRLVGQWEQWH
jgi:hypothetical protein